MYSIDQREAQQQQRIYDGIRDGSLSRSEAARLERGEQRIERYETRARADGVVTHAERQRLERMLDREGREIYHERHDNQQAWGHEGSGWQHSGWDHDGWNRGHQYGWERGEHNGWQHSSGFERREAFQQNRIYNGVREGQITRNEFGRLENGEARISRAESRARADGVVTSAERSHINNMLNREIRDINRAWHNNQVAAGGANTGTGRSANPATSPTWGNRWQRQQPATTGTMTASTLRTWGGQQGMLPASSVQTRVANAAASPPAGGRSFAGHR